MGLKGLFSQLHEIHTYLKDVVDGKLPINHQIVYLLQDVFNLLPDVNLQSFVKSVYVKTNDQMLVVYVAALVRSIIALHNLINNKVQNRDAEKNEGKEKDPKDKKKEDAGKGDTEKKNGTTTAVKTGDGAKDSKDAPSPAKKK